MSYNSRNYAAQGGAEWVVGGKLTFLPGAVIEDGASVEYAIVGENTVIHSAAHVGAPPDGTDAWGVATCGPNIEIRGSASVPAGAMIYTGEEV